MFTKGEFTSVDQCGNTYSNEGNLQKHLNAIHKGVKYTCTECDFSFTRPQMLKAHKDKIHEGILYQCDECTISSPAKLNLKLHKESLGIRFYCDKCVFEATTKQGLNKHLLVKHYIGSLTKAKVESTMNNWELCSSTFSEKWNLVRHRRQNTHPLLFPCDKCDKVFNMKSNLQRHQGLRVQDFLKFYPCSRL